jgi:holliday junction DNA helicase RuvB
MIENNQNNEQIITPELRKDEASFDLSLRPRALSEFIGQERLKDHLSIFLQAAKQRNETPEHILFYGNPGLGKTSLAHIVASEIGAQIRIASGPTLERVGDLAAILTNMEPGDVLFIDEIHRLNKTIEEVLYPAMEEYALDIIIGKGPSAKTLRLDLPRFTLIGATTRLSLLSAPLRDRFGMTYHLKFYEPQEIEKIIRRSAKILNAAVAPEAAETIARRARFTPRVGNRLLKRVRDFAQVKNNGDITSEIANEALTHLEIDELGLDNIDREILKTIITKFNGGPVGLGTLAAATREEIATIEEIYEPFLLQLGLLSRTPRGRVATELAYKHLNINLLS